VKREWRLPIALERIHRPKPACAGVQVSGSVVAEVEVGVELFAGEEVVVGRGAGGVDEVCAGSLGNLLL
jgi:hypothetical protein